MNQLLLFLLFISQILASYNLYSSLNLHNEVGMLFSLYYFPEPVRSRILNDITNNSILNDDALYQMALQCMPSIGKETFQMALSRWKLKLALKRVHGLEFQNYQLGKGLLSMDQLLVVHALENSTIIKSHGYAAEMTKEFYYAFLMMQHWNSAIAWRMSRIIFSLMSTTLQIDLSPLTPEEIKAYSSGKVLIPLSETSDLAAYLELYDTPKSTMSFIDRIARASSIDKSPVYSIPIKAVYIAPLFNPFDYDPSERKNLFQHILALQQWKRIQDFRLGHIIKKPNTPLELLVLCKAANAHFCLLLQKMDKYPVLQSYLTEYFSKALRWNLSINGDLIIFSNHHDMSLRRRAAVQEYVDIFGLPGPLRAYMFYLMHEDLDAHYGKFIEAEYLIGTAQRKILLSLEGRKKIGQVDLAISDLYLKEVCLAWINYWSFLMGKAGQLNNQTSENTFLQRITRDYFTSGVIPVFMPTEHFLKAITDAILEEGSFLMGFSELIAEGDMPMLIKYFMEYEDALERFLVQKGVPMDATFRINALKVALVKFDLLRNSPH